MLIILKNCSPKKLKLIKYKQKIKQQTLSKEYKNLCDSTKCLCPYVTTRIKFYYKTNREITIVVQMLF